MSLLSALDVDRVHNVVVSFVAPALPIDRIDHVDSELFFDEWRLWFAHSPSLVFLSRCCSALRTAHSRILPADVVGLLVRVHDIRLNAYIRWTCNLDYDSDA